MLLTSSADIVPNRSRMSRFNSCSVLANERSLTEVYRVLVAGLAIVWTVPAAASASAWRAVRAAPPVPADRGADLDGWPQSRPKAG